jgi:OOP family OmpA-OmpF porin
MKKLVLLAVAGMLSVASLASAANKEGQFSVSPVIGGYTFEGKQHLDTSLIYGLRGGYNYTKNFGVEALFDYVKADSTRGGNDVSMYRYGAEMLYHFFPDNKFVPYVAAGLGGINFDGKGADKHGKVAFDYGVGAKYFLTENFALRGDVRHLIYNPNDKANNNLEYTLGAYIPFGGVTPAAKPIAPPPAPAPAPAPKAVEPPPAPAPAPPAAPTAALTISPSTVTRGETATLNWRSQNATTCDIQPGIGQVPPQGARAIVPADSAAYTITCNGRGGVATSAANVAVIAPPAPAPAPVVVATKPTPAAEKFCSKPAIINIQFDTDKSNIKPQYDAELKGVSDFLKEFPKAKGEISGHTDNVASKGYNEKLSQSRADSVKKYIVEKYGIAADRITTKGYGFSKPIASNKTKEGKAKNRRIEANFTCE